MDRMTDDNRIKDEAIDAIIDNLFFVHMLTHRKLFKVDFETVSRDIFRPHVVIMRILKDSGSLPVSEVGRRVAISRPQMTHLLDKLISLGLVERIPDANDRRVINVGLTTLGGKDLKQCRGLVRENIKRKLSLLEDDEIAKLSATLQALRELGSKLE